MLRLFDEMGLLDDVLALDRVEVRRPGVRVSGRRYEVVDFGYLSARYPFAVPMEQPALLRLLIDRADEYDGFSFRPATAARDLRREDGRIAGVAVRDREADEVAVLRAQRRIEAAVSALVLHGDRVPDWVLGPALRAVFTVLPRTPLASRTARLFAWGLEPVAVDTVAFEG